MLAFNRGVRPLGQPRATARRSAMVLFLMTLIVALPLMMLLRLREGRLVA